MTTQVSFTTDAELKTRALNKAKSEGITLKAFLTYAMRSFVDGKISLAIDVSQKEADVEEIVFSDRDLNLKAEKLANLLK